MFGPMPLIMRIMLPYAPQVLLVIVDALMLALVRKLYADVPAQRNPLYGYRTSFSMKNADTWQVANAYSRQALRRLVFLLVAGQLVGIVVFSANDLLKLSIAYIVSGGIGVVAFTEWHLHKVFDRDGLRWNK